MKQLIFVCMLSAGIATLHAQGAMSTTGGDENSPAKTTNVKDDPFWKTDVSVDKKIITLSNLPAYLYKVKAIITDSEGEFVKQMKVDPLNNKIDISKASSGMYFVTLTYRNDSKKAFVIHI